MSSKVNSSSRISSARGAFSFASSSSTLRSVLRSTLLRMSASDLTPPAAAYSCALTLESLARTTASTCSTTSGRVSLITAIRRATSAWCSGSSMARTWAASVVCRLAITSAIVCADSERRKTWICSAGVRRRNSNGRRSIVAASRPTISAAFSGPSERSRMARA
jgi:hypothetical protein